MNKLLEFTLYTELQAIPKDKIKLQLRLCNLAVPLVFIQTQVRERDIYQGTLVPKLTLGPFLTLSVRIGHKLKDWVLGIPARVKVDSKNYNQHFINMTRTTIPNFKL